MTLPQLISARLSAAETARANEARHRRVSRRLRSTTADVRRRAHARANWDAISAVELIDALEAPAGAFSFMTFKGFPCFWGFPADSETNYQGWLDGQTWARYAAWQAGETVCYYLHGS